jgi:hypothetical protein
VCALHIKLARLGKRLRRWSRQKLKKIHRESDEVEALVLRLDQEQDMRPLDDVEVRGRRLAKDKILAMASIQKIKLRQRSRLTWIRTGNANTKLFHLYANAWRRKNYPLDTAAW